MTPSDETVLSFRWPVDLALTVASHGWVHLAPWHWDARPAGSPVSRSSGARSAE